MRSNNTLHNALFSNGLFARQGKIWKSVSFASIVLIKVYPIHIQNHKKYTQSFPAIFQCHGANKWSRNQGCKEWEMSKKSQNNFKVPKRGHQWADERNDEGQMFMDLMYSQLHASSKSHLTIIHSSTSFFFPSLSLFDHERKSWKTQQRSDLSPANIKHSPGRRSLYMRDSNCFFLRGCYLRTVKTAQSGAAQWEARSLSVPLRSQLNSIWGQLSTTARLRHPCWFSVPIGEPRSRTPPTRRPLLDCTGWCLYRCAVSKTAEQAAANRLEDFLMAQPSRFNRLWRFTDESGWRGTHFLSLWVQKHEMGSFLQSDSFFNDQC